MSQESRPDVTGILPGCHRISARIRREGWPDGAGILTGAEKLIILQKDDYLTIKPGEFALLETAEEIHLPSDIMGFISVKFSYKKLGLINISGFHVDPNYKGKLVFSVFNAGPTDILMQRGKPVFMIFFCEISQGLEIFAEKIRSLDCLDEKEIEVLERNKDKYLKRSGFKQIPTEMMALIKGTSVSLAQNNEKIDRLETQIKIYSSIAVAIIISLFGLLVQGGLGR